MLVLSLAAAATLVAPVTGGASHGGPDTQDPRDWVEGSALLVVDPANLPGSGDRLVFESTSVPMGAANGTVTLTSSDGGELRGRVQCQIVHEHSATLGGDVLDDGGRTTGEHFALRVTDNRTRDDAAFDVVLFASLAETAGDCSGEDFANLPGVAVAVGNATVHDAE